MLEVKKIKRSWCVVYGKSTLGQFRSEIAANKSLEQDREFYEYWSGSAGVSIENTEAEIKVIA